MTKFKRIPYGKRDFEAVNAKNEYYVDKTMYIPRLKMTPFIFFIRPRRFGKTLLLSMLQSYYAFLIEFKYIKRTDDKVHLEQRENVPGPMIRLLPEYDLLSIP